MKHAFGIIGAGGIAEVHARAIQSIAGTELTGVYDVHPDKTRAFGQRFNCKAFNSADELCHDKNIDIVCICTPSGSHLEPSVKAIREGKHCIIEKPLEITLERCDSIIEEGIRHNVIVSGIFPMRFADVNVELKKAIDEERFGKFVFGDVYIKWFRSQEYYSEVKWRGSLKNGGGGAIMNQGIHSVDLLQWCMGKVESVFAFTSSPGHKDLEVEDTAVAAIRFKNGALGVIEASTAVNPGFYRKIEILGTKGSVIIEEEIIRTWKFDIEKDEDQKIRERFSGSQASGGGVSDPKAISDVGHIKQIRDIIGAIDHGHQPAIDGVEARKAVELVLAVYESARINKAVNL